MPKKRVTATIIPFALTLICVLAVSDAHAACGYYNQYSNLNECLQAEADCLNSAQVYLTGCNMYCDGYDTSWGEDWNRCERPVTHTGSMEAVDFSYGALSTGGIFIWHVGEGVVHIAEDFAGLLMTLGQQGWQCVSFGGSDWSEWGWSCATTAVVGGVTALVIFYPPSAPIVGAVGTTISAGMGAYHSFQCVATYADGTAMSSADSEEYCRRAAFEGTMTLVGAATMRSTAAADDVANVVDDAVNSVDDGVQLVDEVLNVTDDLAGLKPEHEMMYSETVEPNLFSALYPSEEGGLWWVGYVEGGPSTASYVAVVGEENGVLTVLASGGSEFGSAVRLNNLSARAAELGGTPVGVTEVWVNADTWFSYAIVPNDTSPQLLQALSRIGTVIRYSEWPLFYETLLQPLIRG